MHIRAMLSTHPQAAHTQARDRIDEPLARCIEACLDCAQTCVACADACLAEPGVQSLGRCIRLTLDCAEACAATGPILSRRTHASAALLRRMVETCAELCRACAAECDRHAPMHEHCRICSEVCRACESACRAAAERLGVAGA